EAKQSLHVYRTVGMCPHLGRGREVEDVASAALAARRTLELTEPLVGFPRHPVAAEPLDVDEDRLPYDRPAPALRVRDGPCGRPVVGEVRHHALGEQLERAQDVPLR